jgi:hypothetical protein
LAAWYIAFKDMQICSTNRGFTHTNNGICRRCNAWHGHLLQSFPARPPVYQRFHDVIRSHSLLILADDMDDDFDRAQYLERMSGG